MTASRKSPRTTGKAEPAAGAWVRIPTSLLDSCSVSVAELALYAELARHADGDGYARVSLRHLAARRRLAVNTVRACTAKLAEQGAIQVMRQEGQRGGPSTTTYRVLAPTGTDGESTPYTPTPSHQQTERELVVPKSRAYAVLYSLALKPDEVEEVVRQIEAAATEAEIERVLSIVQEVVSGATGA